MKNNKPIKFLAGSMLMSLVLSTGVFAADVLNENTGSESTNTASVLINTVTNFLVENSATVNNVDDSLLNTGENSADTNVGDGTVSSGNIDGSFTVKNTLNGVEVNVDPMNNLSTLGAAAKNTSTGAGSDNSTLFQVSNDRNITVSNTMNVQNIDPTVLTTGGNSADSNTGNGSASSGNIHFAVSFETIGNIVKINLARAGVLPTDGKGGGFFQDEPVLLASITELLPTSLPVAGANNLMLLLIISGVGTLLVVQLLDRLFPKEPAFR